MWTEASASYKERPSFAPQLTLIPLREEVADSQPEPMSWQLGGISSFSLMGDAPASEAKLPGLTVSLKEGTTFKVPNVVPVKKKRGRPPTNKTLDPTKTPSPRKAKVKVTVYLLVVSSSLNGNRPMFCSCLLMNSTGSKACFRAVHCIGWKLRETFELGCSTVP